MSVPASFIVLQPLCSTSGLKWGSTCHLFSFQSTALVSSPFTSLHLPFTPPSHLLSLLSQTPLLKPLCSNETQRGSRPRSEARGNEPDPHLSRPDNTKMAAQTKTQSSSQEQQGPVSSHLRAICEYLLDHPASAPIDVLHFEKQSCRRCELGKTPDCGACFICCARPGEMVGHRQRGGATSHCEARNVDVESPAAKSKRYSQIAQVT